MIIFFPSFQASVGKLQLSVALMCDMDMSTTLLIHIKVIKLYVSALYKESSRSIGSFGPDMQSVKCFIASLYLTLC